MSRFVRLMGILLAFGTMAAKPGVGQPARPIFPLAEVRGGQRGVGKSVFRGTRVESFNIEIIGVLRRFEGTRSVILGRVLDGPVVTRKSGIIQGMSGSPVYIKGRLAGAIAYAWSWSKEPITGITPIEEMLEAWQEGRAKPKAAPDSGGATAAPLQLRGQVIGNLMVGPRPSRPDPPGTMTLTPLSGFVQASGLNQRARSQLAELLAPYGMRVVAGASGGMEHLRPPLVPGAAVGAQLVGGDFDIAALGTVTMTEGKRVLAFGHPLFQLGEIDVPMTGAYVHDILPTLDISSKIMSSTQVVGRVLRDLQAGVAGEVGGKARMLPVTVQVADGDRGKTRRFELRVAQIRELLPALTGMSVLTAIDETRGRISRGTARVMVDLEVEGRPALRREEIAYSDGDAALAAVPAVVRPLATFIDSPFGKLRFQRLRVRVETQEERRTATIERATLPQARIKAGEEVTLAVTLRPYGRELAEVPVRLKVPADLPRSTLRVVISGGGESDEARSSIGAPRPAPVSLAQVIERYLTQDPRQYLVVQAALPRTGAAMLGEELPDFPRGALEALRTTHATDLRPATPVLKLTVPTPWILSGRQTVTLQVEGPPPPGPPMPPPPPGPPGAPPAEEEEEEPKEQSAAASLGLTAHEMASASSANEMAMPRGSGAPPPPGARPPQPQPQPPAKKEEPQAKPLTRAPEAWVQQSKADFAQAKLIDVTLGDEGRFALAPSRTELGSLPVDAIWSLAVRDGEVYAGTGSSGLIYKVSSSGQISRFFATEELSVHALAFDKEGNLYAGTAPRGKLFQIAPDGTGKLIYDSESSYLWSLVIAPDSTIYAGGGTPGRIYAIRPDGEAKVLAELPVANVLSLLRRSEGDLYAGTAESGVVYRVRPDGSASAVGQVAGTSVEGLAMDESGHLYASSTPSGEIYRLPPGGPAGLYCDTGGERLIYGLAFLPGPGEAARLVAATGPNGVMVEVGADRKARVMFRPESGVATALATEGEAIYLGTTGPATLRRFGPGYAASGVLESAPLDAGRTAAWGYFHYVAETPTGTAVRVEARSGDTPRPEQQWSEWSAVSTVSEARAAASLGGPIASPAAKRLQYRLVLTTTDPKVTPTVRQVRVTYRPENRPPRVVIKAPAAGERMTKKYTIRWEGQDPDKDTLTYDVAVSKDMGATWKTLKEGLTDVKYDWDTTPTGDGRCLLRVTARDAQSAPSDPREAEASVVTWVDNTAPTVLLLRSSLTVGDDSRVQVKGVATDQLSSLRSIEYRVDNAADWRSLPLPAVDSLVTEFAVTTKPLPPGPHTVEVRGFDAAGNLGSDKVQAKVK